jgi:hypothetical protein
MCRRFVGRMSELLKRMPARLRGVLEGGQHARVLQGNRGNTGQRPG